jgi:hypothetical protein
MTSPPRSVSTSSSNLSQQKSPGSIEDADTEAVLQKSSTLNENRSRDRPSGRLSVFEDVTIPSNILRFANTTKDWSPNVEAAGSGDQHQTDSPGFNVVDIALEQQGVKDFAYNHARASHLTPSRTKSTQDHDQAANRRQPSLPALSKEQTRETARSQRWSASGMGQDAASANHQTSNTILFRSLDNYTMDNAADNHGHRRSVAIAPESDYLAAYEGTMEKTTSQDSSQDTLYMAKTETEQPTNPSGARRASYAVATLYRTITRTITQRTTDFMRRSSLYDVYQNAKIRGQHLQRKKWVQITFEYAFYLILLCFIYFVLVGQPLWGGAVWWLYWVVDHKFTVAGTWSITIGLAIM